jgi:hypothetical protein
VGQVLFDVSSELSGKCRAYAFEGQNQVCEASV